MNLKLNVFFFFLFFFLFFLSSSSSSSTGTTAHCGLWPVEQCPSIFSYLPPTLSIFSLPALEDLFLLPLSIFSWVFHFFVPSSSWVKIFFGILPSSIPSRWPNQLIFCPFFPFYYTFSFAHLFQFSIRPKSGSPSSRYHKPSLPVYSAVRFVMWPVFFYSHPRGLNP